MRDLLCQVDQRPIVGKGVMLLEIRGPDGERGQAKWDNCPVTGPEDLHYMPLHPNCFKDVFDAFFINTQNESFVVFLTAGAVADLKGGLPEFDEEEEDGENQET